MIELGLPFNNETLDEVRNNPENYIVDMSDINFEGDKFKIALIYLRNIEIPVKLDFSKLSTKERFELLTLWITENIKLENKEIIDTWMSILFQCVYTEKTSLDSILSYNEQETYIQEFKDTLLEGIFKFIVSLPVFCVKYFNASEGLKQDIKTTNEKPVGINFNFLIKQKCFSELYGVDYKFEPVDYINLFTEQNMELFEAVQCLPFGAVLLGLIERSPEEWNKVLHSEVVFG